MHVPLDCACCAGVGGYAKVSPATPWVTCLYPTPPWKVCGLPKDVPGYTLGYVNLDPPRLHEVSPATR